MRDYQTLELIDLTIKDYLENGYKNNDIVKVIANKYFNNNLTQAHDYLEQYLSVAEKDYQEEEANLEEDDYPVKQDWLDY